MMMFALPVGTPARLVHLNVRGEFHGAEVVPQLDLRFEVALPNAILDTLDPELRACLYSTAYAPHPGAMLPDLPGIAPLSDTPQLRFPDLAMPLRWKAEGKGFRLVIAGLPIGTLIVADVTIKNMRLDCLDGGSVGVDFTASTIESPGPDVVAALSILVQREVAISVMPPRLPRQSGADESSELTLDADAFPDPAPLD